jgi:hypothetical protein
VLFSLGGSGGIRTHVPGTDNRISSAARYDHFDTLPYYIVVYDVLAAVYKIRATLSRDFEISLPIAASNDYYSTPRRRLQAQIEKELLCQPASSKIGIVFF